MGDAVLRQFGAQRKRAAADRRRVGGGHFVAGDQTEVGTAGHIALQRDPEIGDRKLMLDEGATGLPVLAAPFDIRRGAVAGDQQPRAAIGERVDDRRRARIWIIVELGARPIDIAGVEKPHQAIVGAVEEASDQHRDVARSQEPVAAAPAP
jgi:hypothetical protein